MSAQQRFAVDFVDRLDREDRGIETVYWHESDGSVSGEAYFRRDDYCAQISNGEFEHPYSGLRFKLHVPSRFGKSQDAILDVLKWTNFGRSKPVACTTEGGAS